MNRIKHPKKVNRKEPWAKLSDGEREKLAEVGPEDFVIAKGSNTGSWWIYSNRLDAFLSGWFISEDVASKYIAEKKYLGENEVKLIENIDI